MKKVVIIFSSLIFLVFSIFSFSFENDEIESYLDKLNSGHIEHKKHEEKLEKVISEIDAQLEIDDSNAYLWYLKGRSTFAALKIHGVLYGRNDDKYKEYQNLVPKEYGRSLDLNKNSKILTEQQLGYNIFGSRSVTLEATRQYIDLKKQKGTLEKKEHLRLLREKVVPLLIKQDKFEEALVEIDYIDANFPEYAEGSTGNAAWRKYFEQEIESQKIKTKKVEQQEKAVQSSDPEGAEKAEEKSEQQAGSEKDKIKKEKVMEGSDNNLLLILGAALVMLLFFGLIAVSQRRKL